MTKAAEHAIYELMSIVAENFHTVKNDIEESAQAYGRAADDVTLIAVSKRQPQEKIKQALEAGHRVFGENKVQEAQKHWADLRKRYPDVQLHLIGPLQSNKAKQAVALFDYIETLDRKKLVDSLADEMQKQGKNIPCFIQVNTGEEPQKSGVLPEDLVDLINYARSKNINVTGLMCIPPIDEPPALHFAFLKKLAARHGLSGLSMGMSGDYKKAIACGATHIRVGSALFGERSNH